MSYINRNRARQTGTNRATQAEISNGFWLSFPGRVKTEKLHLSVVEKSGAGHRLVLLIVSVILLGYGIYVLLPRSADHSF